tara:strand:+ start:42 stop:950 length:909 start_codon:yes stop_codon:yes gene_type:complete
VNLFSVIVEPIFASKEEAENLLAELDDYTSNLNEFELKARLQTDEETTVADYLEYARNQALNWENGLISDVQQALSELSEPLRSRPMPLPDKVWFVLTTGLEEDHSAYTRGIAIFLNETIIGNALRSGEFTRLIAHELVHVATRNSSTWRDRLYTKIGFMPCEQASFSPEFQPFVFTNPDAPIVEHALEITWDGIQQRVAPIIFSNRNSYDGGKFWDYVSDGLFLLDKENEIDYEFFPEENRIIPFRICEEFFENVGDNTDYLIHAEEILAENIADIYTNRINYQSPEIIRKIMQVLNSESF